MAYGLLDAEAQEELANFLRDHLKIRGKRFEDGLDCYIKVELLIDDEVISTDKFDMPRTFQGD